MDFVTWVNFIKGIGGVPVTWPFQGGEFGQPAARFEAAIYDAAIESGHLTGAEPAQATNDGAYVYVRYSSVTAQPHTMTAFESFENSVFTAGDTAADALGLPSLAGVGDFLKDAGKQIVLGVVVAAGVGYLLKRKR